MIKTIAHQRDFIMMEILKPWLIDSAGLEKGQVRQAVIGQVERKKERKEMGENRIVWRKRAKAHLLVV